MGDEVKIDKQVFHTRLGNLLAAWKDSKRNDVFGGAEALLVVLGKTQDGPYSKSLALQVCVSWELLLGAAGSYKVAELEDGSADESFWDCSFGFWATNFRLHCS